MSKGKVLLVGAGPGDASLITVKGLLAIREAQVIVHDRLVNLELISQAPPHCQIINVGKTSNHHPVPQEQINQILVEHAMAGKNVVRLKGGDPYVFGRGGEEAEALAHEEIPFEIIPGISSAIGGLAYAGIPVTHRHYASSFHVVTGHMCQGNEPQNWDVLAQLDGTLIVLMGMTRQEEICQRLIDGGKSPDTPAAAVMYASQQRQEIAKGTLTTLKDEIVRKKLHAPALLVIGHVVNLSDVLAFTARQIDISHEPLLQVI
ncbi:uroporphyrinogen-III C-methyltransferase [Yersinia intermedia]|jgi:uroporphyrin-III C-methyltransferase|uniref:uroporphyrinogen-III C-methyltransferase n=1 Tax=Yersinia intermedia TaxID=631 RepID=A0A208ZVR1_YERIN|nr:uroporphyrinogen-III C-methyltransferase [Yersinia intermedia]MCB5311972.1 uroporphyrinogen-III C-methyltransferase [Yersinia intermedia]MCB5322840.1 uroporphyrinogen-III C-methyltransferase [Yersinia intermedia]MCB5325302.1 uroporphyrinogen-III C-methyltransferase [Yersinia intermedia]MDA5496027.1 uroporphyrinogen-III C-methyltransferase [Yersinia intermedia]OVZ84587.1 uroporphyrinogen-III C-methyltransferase [Yersinia intermedia]